VAGKKKDARDTSKDAPGTQAGPIEDPEDIPATSGAAPGQGGTSQPGPPTDPEDVDGNIDFSKPEGGTGGTDRA
jgi:hypothetical protein